MATQEAEWSKKNVKKITVAATCGALASLLGISAAAAYLTGAVEAINPFTINTDLKVEITEPAFSTEAAANILPAQTVPKDPTITNAGSIPVYVAADVKIPVFTGSAMIEGVNTDMTNADLFSYAVNDGWEQDGEAQLKDGYRTYRYIYTSKLEPKASTKSIFDEVTLANLTQDAGISTTSVDISAYAIQSEGFTNAQEACAAYDASERA